MQMRSPYNIQNVWDSNYSDKNERFGLGNKLTSKLSDETNMKELV